MKEQCFWRGMFSFFCSKTKKNVVEKLYVEGKNPEPKVVSESDGGYYMIRDTAELLWVAEEVNNGNSFDGKIVELACDLDIRHISWKPIGVSAAKAFRGVFEGGGHVIKGLRLESDKAYVGFFGYVMGTGKVRQAAVRSLCLQDVKILGENERACVGAVVAKAQEGVIIEKCCVSGEIESRGYIGGIVGYAEDCVIIRRCVVKGRLSGEIVGGLVCYLCENSVIDNCQSDIETTASVLVNNLVYEVQENSMIRECGTAVF